MNNAVIIKGLTGFFGWLALLSDNAVIIKHFTFIIAMSNAVIIKHFTVI